MHVRVYEYIFIASIYSLQYIDVTEIQMILRVFEPRNVIC